MIAEMTAYFPGVTHGIAVNTEKISSAADVAVVKEMSQGWESNRSPLPMATARPSVGADCAAWISYGS